MAKRLKVISTKETEFAFIKVYPGGFEVHDMKVPLLLPIEEKAMSEAKCSDPSQCVIAKALARYYLGAVVDFEIGPSISKIYFHNKILRFGTSSALSRAIPQFDNSEKKGVHGLLRWNLAPGIYKLLPISKSYRRPHRLDKIKHSGGVKSVFSGVKAAPTRFTKNIFELMDHMKKAA